MFGIFRGAQDIANVISVRDILCQLFFQVMKRVDVEQKMSIRFLN